MLRSVSPESRSKSLNLYRLNILGVSMNDIKQLLCNRIIDRRLSYFRGLHLDKHFLQEDMQSSSTPYSFGAGDAMGLQLPAGTWQQSAVLQRRCLVQQTYLYHFLQGLFVFVKSN